MPLQQRPRKVVAMQRCPFKTARLYLQLNVSLLLTSKGTRLVKSNVRQQAIYKVSAQVKRYEAVA